MQPPKQVNSLQPPHINDLVKEAIGKGNHPLVTVVSNSMAPLIKVGDELRLGPATVDSLNRGDIIAYAASSDLIVHRYWGSLEFPSEYVLKTKGDRLIGFDPPVNENQLIGQVISRTRSGKTLSLTSRRGIILNQLLLFISGLQIFLLGLRAKSAQYEATSGNRGLSNIHNLRDQDRVTRTVSGIARILSQLLVFVFELKS